MRTDRSLTVSRGIRGGGVLPNPHDADPPWCRLPLPVDSRNDTRLWNITFRQLLLLAVNNNAHRPILDCLGRFSMTRTTWSYGIWFDRQQDINFYFIKRFQYRLFVFSFGYTSLPPPRNKIWGWHLRFPRGQDTSYWNAFMSIRDLFIMGWDRTDHLPAGRWGGGSLIYNFVKNFLYNPPNYTNAELI